MPEDILGRILRLPGYGAYQTAFDEESSTASHTLDQAGGQAALLHLQAAASGWSRSTTPTSAGCVIFPGERGRSGWCSKFTGSVAGGVE